MSLIPGTVRQIKMKLFHFHFPLPTIVYKKILDDKFKCKFI